MPSAISDLGPFWQPDRRRDKLPNPLLGTDGRLNELSAGAELPARKRRTMTLALWAGFVTLILAILAFDLGVLNRQARVVSLRRALLFSGFCAVLALAFSGVVYFLYSHGWLRAEAPDGRLLTARDAALQFLTGWIVEQSLSLDNIFVIALVFSYFTVPRSFQHRTLFWGIMGALVMRGLMIGAGTALIQRFTWIIYVFGGLLLFTAGKMLFSREEHVAPERNPLVRLARRIYPVSPGFVRERFFTRLEGRRAITPLFLVLLVVESMDVMFAIDSIPAVFAITHPYNAPFIVFTSNVFAILNLRSLYFALAGLLERFRYLKSSLVLVLGYVGVKMLLSHHYPIPTGISLLVICGVLLGGVVVSMIAGRRRARTSPAAATLDP